MISISSNQQDIYYLLEKNELLFNDFNSNHVITFDMENDFYVVIYEAVKRNFVLFCAKKYLNESFILSSLIDKLRDIDTESIPADLIEKAIFLTEEKLLSSNGPNLYFDAH